MKKILLIIPTLMLSTIYLLNAQTVNCPINISEIEKNSVLNVFPNPSEGVFQITYGSITPCPPAGWGGMLVVNIKNSRYEIVYTETILNFEGEYIRAIDLSKLEKGVYVIEMAVGKRLKVERELVR